MKPKVVLLLEDDKDIRDIVSYILTNDGYHVKPCGSVKEFHYVMEAVVPDVCLLDITLPDGNGLDVSRQLKENAQTAKIPVLLMTANRNNIDLNSHQHHDDFIAKPFDLSHLIQKLKQYA